MRRRRDRSDTTREITGLEASMDEAEFGTAGNGLTPWGGDLAGGPSLFVEEDPALPTDIVPDQIRSRRGAAVPHSGGEAEVEVDGLMIPPLSSAIPDDLSELP